MRLLIGTQAEVVQTQVCRTQDDVLATGDQWKAAFERNPALDVPKD